MIASSHSIFKKWLLSFNRPRWAFLQAVFVYAVLNFAGDSPWRTSSANYFNYLADSFLHGQMHLRLMPPIAMMPFADIFGEGIVYN